MFPHKLKVFPGFWKKKTKRQQVHHCLVTRAIHATKLLPFSLSFSFFGWAIMFSKCHPICEAFRSTHRIVSSLLRAAWKYPEAIAWGHVIVEHRSHGRCQCLQSFNVFLWQRILFCLTVHECNKNIEKELFFPIESRREVWICGYPAFSKSKERSMDLWLPRLLQKQ